MRYEIKYAIPLIDQAMIVQSILSHPASFSKLFPDRIVNNIYFDTPSLDAYYQNINGDPIRKKYRYRWYGDEKEFNSGRLELKKKAYQLGTKEYPELNLTLNNGTINWDEKKYSPISSLKPFLYNRYQRSYYQSMDGHFRITLDKDLNFKKEFNDHIIETVPQHILELKFDEHVMGMFNDINKFMPFQQTKFSKYAVGITKLLF